MSSYIEHNLGLLVEVFSVEATHQLLTLPSTAVPEDLDCLELTDVPSFFLEQIVSDYGAPECTNVLAQLLSTLPHCKRFNFEIYEVPSDEVLDGLWAIGKSLDDMDVDFSFSYRLPHKDAADVDGEPVVPV